MWTLLAESTVQMVKDQEGFCATFTVNAIETTISALCSRWNTVPGTAPALSFWQKHSLWLRRYTDTEPLKKGLQLLEFGVIVESAPLSLLANV